MKREKKFASLSAEAVPPLPQNIQRAFSFNFVFKGNFNLMKKLVDAWLNDSTDHKFAFELLADTVIVTFVDNQNGFAEKHKLNGFGYTRYLEVVITILIKRKMGFFGEIPKIYSFVPYIFVAHPGPLCCGREFIGMPKVMGNIKFPNVYHPNPDFTFALDSEGLHDGKGEDKRLTTRRLLTISTEEKVYASDYMAERRFDHKKISKSIQQSSEAGLSRKTANKVSTFFKMDFMTLKQYRDFSNPQIAIGKSLVPYFSGDIEIFRGGMIHQKYKIIFPDQLSEAFPIQQTMGIDKYSNSGFWMDWSFTFAPREALWKA